MKIRNNLVITLAAVGLLWAIQLVTIAFHTDLRLYGIRPHDIHGLWGLIFAPFLHGGIAHLAANTIPLFVLLFLSLCYDRMLTFEAVLLIAIVGGVVVWIFGQPDTVHLGASGIIFGLVGFLLFLGFFRHDIRGIAIAAIVLLFYGSTLSTGFIPRAGVSWIYHIAGFLTGVGAAWLSGAANVHQPQ